MPASPGPLNARVALTTEGDVLVVALAGTWQITEPRPSWDGLLAGQNPARVRPRMDEVEKWDSSLLLFLFEVQQWCRMTGAYCETDARPDARGILPGQQAVPRRSRLRDLPRARERHHQHIALGGQRHARIQGSGTGGHGTTSPVTWPAAKPNLHDSMPPFQTILFDLDGTLVDAFTTIHRSYQHTLPRFGRPVPTLAEVRRAVGGGLANAMGHFLPPQLIPEAMAIHLAYSEQILLEDVTLLPGAPDLLRRLQARGVKSAVLTNKLGDAARRLSAHLGVCVFFGGVFVAR